MFIRKMFYEEFSTLNLIRLIRYAYDNDIYRAMYRLYMYVFKALTDIGKEGRLYDVTKKGHKRVKNFLDFVELLLRPAREFLKEVFLGRRRFSSVEEGLKVMDKLLAAIMSRARREGIIEVEPEEDAKKFIGPGYHTWKVYFNKEHFSPDLVEPDEEYSKFYESVSKRPLPQDFGELDEERYREFIQAFHELEEQRQFEIEQKKKRLREQRKNKRADIIKLLKKALVDQHQYGIEPDPRPQKTTKEPITTTKNVLNLNEDFEKINIDPEKVIENSKRLTESLDRLNKKLKQFEDLLKD